MDDAAATMPPKPGTNWLLEAILLVLFIGFAAASSLAVDFIFSSYGLFSVLLKLIVIMAGFFAYCNLSCLKIMDWIIGAIAAGFVLLLVSKLIFLLPPQYWAFLAVIFFGGLLESKLHSSLLNRETSEAKVFAVIVIVGLLALVGTYAITMAGAAPYGDRAAYQNVRVTLHDDSMLIDRTLNYSIASSNYHELYISVNKDSQSAVSLQFESCPYGFRFIKNDYNDYVEYVCRNDNGIAPGDYSVRFVYSLASPYKRGTDFGGLDYIISDTFGMAIDRTNVTLINGLSSSSIQDFFSYPYGQQSGSSVCQDSVFQPIITASNQTLANVKPTTMSAGNWHTCYITSNGSSICYGDNAYGQSANYTGGDAIAVSAGDGYTCYVLQNGNSVCYGNNGYGRSANYTGGDAIAVSARSGSTCYLTNKGNAICYGIAGGQYAEGDAVGVAVGFYHVCNLLSNGNSVCYGDQNCRGHGPCIGNSGESTNYAGGDAVAVTAGIDYTCYLLSNGNSVCYGFNDKGRADGYAGMDAVAVSAGGWHTCYLLSNGNSVCYGGNANGESTGYVGGDAIAVSAGQQHTCYLLSNGNSICYGNNSFGQSANIVGGNIAVPNKTAASAPSQASSQTSAAGAYHACYSIDIGQMKPNTPFSIMALVSNPGILSSYATEGAAKPDFEKTKLAASLDKAISDYRIIVLAMLAIGFIAALFALYARFGKEETVPFDIDTLHTVPNEKRKPWEVNLLFVGTPKRMDSNALYATLMDLESRGIIKIESENRIIYNGVPEGQELDEYERNVVNILSTYGTKDQGGNYVFDAKAVKSSLTANRTLATAFASDFSKVSDYPNVQNTETYGKRLVDSALHQKALSTETYGKRLADSAFDQKGYDAAKAFVSGALLVAIWLFSGSASANSWSVMLPLTVFLSALFIMVIAFGEYLFGRYTHEMIEEKRKWDAFSNLLSNYGMIQKYGKEEILMWKDWLVYATALGVAEKAISQMRQYGNEMADSAYLSFSRTTQFTAIGFYSVNSHAMAMSPSRGGHGGFGGGGFGGGGHGGGGGGAR